MSDPCKWTLDTMGDGDSHYETSCGQGWCLEEGDPKSDGYNFCPSCGRPIEFDPGEENSSQRLLPF